jgi:Domain of Unknown Function (DUF1080)
MRLFFACAVVLCSGVMSIERAVAQDLKKGVTDLAHVDADYFTQGEYFGSVVFSDGCWRNVGLQVVALGDGKFEAIWYQGGLPGNGYDNTSRTKLSGGRTDANVVLTADGLSIELPRRQPAVVKNSAGGVLGCLQKMDRTSSTEGLLAPAGAIVLFDGGNTDRLKNAKVTSDGLLEIGAETKAPVQNFTLHAEFRTPYMPYARGQARGNSGFYLQKRYEVQVLDSFGLELQFNDCASLYRFKAPDLNMSFPPLRWQTYDIDFTAPKFDADGKKTANGRITIRHNGVIVHNNLELENKTGAGSQEGPNPLPILLQNHGNPVHFRNIWLIDHDAPPSSSCSARLFEPGCCAPNRLHRPLRCR